MLERKDVRRDQPVGRRPPAPAVSGPIVGDDQVEIEHQPVQLALPQAGSVEQNCAGGARIKPRHRLGHRAHPRIDRLGQLGRDEGLESLLHGALP